MKNLEVNMRVIGVQEDPGHKINPKILGVTGTIIAHDPKGEHLLETFKQNSPEAYGNLGRLADLLVASATADCPWVVRFDMPVTDKEDPYVVYCHESHLRPLDGAEDAQERTRWETFKKLAGITKEQFEAVLNGASK